jgi:hypothetical protein
MTAELHPRLRFLRCSLAQSILVASVLLIGCADAPDQRPVSLAFEEAFALTAQVTLAEPDVPIGDIGRLEFGPDETLYVLDPILRRVIRFSTDTGQPSAAYGEPGEGPEEFRSLVGLAVDPGTGRVFVTDPQSRVIRRLSPTLTPDTTIRLDRSIGDIQGTMSGGPIVADIYAGRSGPRLNLLDADGTILRTFYELPPSFVTNPYQASLGGPIFAGSGFGIGIIGAA